MKLFHALLVVNRRDQHAAGVDAHHGSRRKICDGDARFSDQFLRLVVIVNAGKDDSIRAGTVVQREFQEFFGLLDRFAGFDLHSPVIGLGEGVKIHEILEQRLDLHVGKINFPSTTGAA